MYFSSSFSTWRPSVQSWPMPVMSPRRLLMTWFMLRTCDWVETNTRPCARCGRAILSSALMSLNLCKGHLAPRDPSSLFLALTLLYSCLTHTVLEPLTRAALKSGQAFSATMGPNLAPQPLLTSLGREMVTMVPMRSSFSSVLDDLGC